MTTPLLTLLIYETILTITSLLLLIDDCKYTGDGNFSKYPHVSLPNSLSFYSVDGDEISAIMRKFKKHKASDPTSVPTDILHYLNHDFARPLSWITNMSFSTGIHPR